MEMPDDESPQARQFKAEQRQQRIYEIILRMVLWDEKEEDVLKKLEVNGFTGEKAQEMYREARRERVAAIRGDCWRGIGAGLVWSGIGISILYQFLYVWGGITLYLIFLIGGAACFGVGKVVKGIIGLVTAPHKTGSLANDE